MGKIGTFFINRARQPRCFRSNQPNIRVDLKTTCFIPLATTSASWAFLVSV
jgi:hypothetical protein